MSRYDHRTAEVFQPMMYLSAISEGGAGFWNVVGIGAFSKPAAGLFLHDLNVYCAGDDLFWGEFTYPGPYTWVDGYTSYAMPVVDSGEEFIKTTTTTTEITTGRLGVFTRWMEVKDINLYIPAGKYIYISPSDENNYFSVAARVRYIND